jgi:hypothetical protein
MASTIDSGLYRNPNRDLVVNIKGTKRLELKDDFAYPKQDWFWTGKPPVHGVCPGVDEDGHMTSLALPKCDEVSLSSGAPCEARSSMNICRPACEAESSVDFIRK